MKRILTLLVSLLCTAAFGQFNPQSDAITKKFFPEAELEISTPAFKKSEGFTNYSEMINWLQTACGGKEALVSISYIGESQKGKKIPMLTFNRKNGRPKIRIWMQGGLHGDEPAGAETMLYLTDRLINEPSLSYLLDDLEIAIVPMANIDGYEQQKRVSANGIDLNRDQTSLKAPESIALKRAFTQFNPVVSLDFHEYRPFRKDFTRFGKGGVTALYDAMFLYSGNLNVPENLRNFTQDHFVENACKSLDRNNLRHHDYVTPQKNGGRVEFNLGSVHSRSSATSYALANSVSTLLEIRGVGIGRTSFKRRIKTSYLIALSYLETAVKETSELERVLATSLSAQNPVVVTSDRLEQKDTLSMIDLGTNKEIRLPVFVHNALKSRPLLQRDRPNAYLVSTTEKQVIFRLGILGIRLDSLAQETELEVQTYDFGAVQTTENEEDERDEEGEDLPLTSGNTKLIRKKFAKGTYVVYMDQQRANLATEVLEPENVNSFVAMGILKHQPGAQLPVYRYLKPGKIEP